VKLTEDEITTKQLQSYSNDWDGFFQQDADETQVPFSVGLEKNGQNGSITALEPIRFLKLETVMMAKHVQQPYVPMHSAYATKKDLVIKGTGTWCFRVLAIFETGLTAPSSVLTSVVADPIKAEVLASDDIKWAFEYDPGHQFTSVFVSKAKPAATLSWLKDGATLATTKANRLDERANETVCHLFKPNSHPLACSSTPSLASNDAYASSKWTTQIITLNISNLTRQDAGTYELNLVNYLGKTIPTKLQLKVACLKCDQCVPNSKADIDKYGVDKGCICTDGFFQEPSPVIAEKPPHKLGFKCTPCPTGGICMGNPKVDDIVSNASYFRVNQTEPRLYPCTGSPEGACARAEFGKQCSSATTGLLCHKCISTPVQHFRSIDTCKPCPEPSIDVQNTVIGVLVVVLAILTIVFSEIARTPILLIPGDTIADTDGTNDGTDDHSDTDDGDDSNCAVAAEAHDLHDTYKGAKEGADQLEVEARKSFKMKPRAKPKPTPSLVQRLRIAVTWVQCLGPFVFTFSIPWPKAFADQLTVLNDIFTIDIFNLIGNIGTISCEMNTDFFSGFGPHMLLLPLLLLTMSMAYVIARLRGPKVLKVKGACLDSKEAITTRLVQVLLSIVFLLYPGICAKLFRLFKCTDYSGTFYLDADLTVRCFEGKHAEYTRYGIVGMLVYAFGIPLGLFTVLFWQRRAIHTDIQQTNTAMVARWGQIYAGYNADVYYFEIIEMMRKMILTGALALIEPGSLLQIFLGILICAAYVVILIHASPFRVGMDNILAESTGAQLFATLMIGFWVTSSKLSTEVKQAGGTGTNDPYDETIVATILLLLYFVTIAVLILASLTTFQTLFTTSAGLTRKLSRRMSGRSPANEAVEKAPVGLDELHDTLELALDSTLKLGRCDEKGRSQPVKGNKLMNKKKAHRRPEQRTVDETVHQEVAAIINGAPPTPPPSTPPPRLPSPAEFALKQSSEGMTVEERRQQEMEMAANL
jgi:hypothetical protein